METITVFFIVEIIGTVAFACSGAMVAIKKNLDLLGIIVLGVTTAVGGGMIRDILIGIHPPALFTNPVYVMAAFVAVLCLFLIIKCRCITIEALSSLWYERVMNILDAVGLGAFTVVGIDTAITAGFGEYNFLMIFLGVITGVGGGVLRDIMASTDAPPCVCLRVSGRGGQLCAFAEGSGKRMGSDSQCIPGGGDPISAPPL